MLPSINVSSSRRRSANATCTVTTGGSSPYFSSSLALVLTAMALVLLLPYHHHYWGTRQHLFVVVGAEGLAVAVEDGVGGNGDSDGDSGGSATHLRPPNTPPKRDDSSFLLPQHDIVGGGGRSAFDFGNRRSGIINSDNSGDNNDATDAAGEFIVVGFKQVVCEAACPFDSPRSVNCTTQTFRIGDCVPTTEDGWYALVMGCVGPDLPPIPPTPKPTTRLASMEGGEAIGSRETETAGGVDEGISSESIRLPLLPPPSPHGAAAPAHHGKGSYAAGSMRRRPPIPPHITIRYVYNANSTYNGSLSYQGSNQTRLSKEAVAKCFPLTSEEEHARVSSPSSRGILRGLGRDRDASFPFGRPDDTTFYSSSRMVIQHTKAEGEEEEEGIAFNKDAKSQFLYAFNSRRRSHMEDAADGQGNDVRYFAVNYCFSKKVKH